MNNKYEQTKIKEMFPKRKRFDILVDLDDVLNNLVNYWVDYLNKKYNLNIDASLIKSWDIKKYIPELTKEQVFEVIYQNEFWEKIKVKDQADYYINRLLDDGHKITIVTASNHETIDTKMKWLYKHFPRIKWKDIIITSQKQKIKGDILIDDGYHNLINGEYRKILMHMSHNENCETEEQCINRMYNWEEIYNLITEWSYEEAE